MIDSLHIGRGTTRGALTLFPIWGEGQAGPAYSTLTDDVAVSELPDGARVDRLVVSNTGRQPLLLVAGELLAGGQQDRMVAETVLVPALERTEVDVVCVEQGRWGGNGTHRSSGLRAGSRIRSGLRSAGTGHGAGPRRQEAVWSRVAEVGTRHGASPAGSYLAYDERVQPEAAEMAAALKPFPGQIGVMVGIAGHPVFAEVFDRPIALRRQFQSIVAAAVFDSAGQAPIATPSHRARRFLELAAGVRAQGAEQAGIGMRRCGGTDKAEVASLDWMDHEIHALLTNPRHQLNLLEA
ncbi:ARPP-1 family domain-containing protein [Zhihengliuella salsuginis]|uniref:ARG and Rhodanese-Phosphatase-superfamily-associated domain-containing protein n=1 Tax=Zhihengliuella salsuginis TaxID=578222 RepID=A0ABQ3GH46_9MICC|nr:DUF6569 family protein [Zhihengliuella salsuginis]GHD06227.1 hypothetical protein GCM10008096_15960 [Zhihengliuella salsuginis]